MQAVRGCLGLFLPCFREPVGSDDCYTELRDTLRSIDSSYRDTEYFNALHEAFKACYSLSSTPDIEAWGLSTTLISDFGQLNRLKGSRSKEQCDAATISGIPRYIIAEIVGDAVQLEDIGDIQGRYVKVLDEECAICLEPMNGNDFQNKTLLRVRCCGKFLHTICLNGWKKKGCITCRAELDRDKNAANWERTLDAIHTPARKILGLFSDEEIAREIARQEQAQIDAQEAANLAAARALALQITQEV